MAKETKGKDGEKEFKERLQRIKIDKNTIESRLYNIMEKEELKDLLMSMVSKMTKSKLPKLLCDEEYFSFKELLTTLEKIDKNKFMELIEEPKDEKEMAEPLKDELKNRGYKVAQEVPLPKVGRARPRKMDVAGYKKRGITKRVSVFGFELKARPTRNAIDSAFSQARDYLNYCEQVVVAFSPLMYLKYADVIEDKAQKEEEIGVWIVSKKRILYRIKDAYAREVPDKMQRSIVEYIEKG